LAPRHTLPGPHPVAGARSGGQARSRGRAL